MKLQLSLCADFQALDKRKGPAHSRLQNLTISQHEWVACSWK